MVKYDDEALVFPQESHRIWNSSIRAQTRGSPSNYIKT
jgi:hypothetical protein